MTSGPENGLCVGAAMIGRNKLCGGIAHMYTICCMLLASCWVCCQRGALPCQAGACVSSAGWGCVSCHGCH
jgi:hypothetical protein